MILNVSGNTDEIPQWAQEEKPVKMSYYLGLGASVTVSDLAKGWNAGYHGLGRIGFEASPVLSILAGFEYHYFSFKDQPDTSVSGSNFTSRNFIGELKLNLASPAHGVNPYFFAGAGLAITRISDSTYRIYNDTLVNRGAVTYKTETDALIEFGAGLEYKILFIQCRYLSVLSDSTTVSYVPITLGVKF